MTSERLLVSDLVPPRVKVYFYDGDHSYEGTRHGVVGCEPLMCDRAYLLMDDWNDPVIQEATWDGLDACGLEVLWSRE